MLTTTRRLLTLAVLLAWVLAACGPGPAPAAQPTEEPPTAAPTDTPEPTATATVPPTDTPTPSPLPPTDTPTPVPPTNTPRPTATPTPGPGDVIYAPVYETDWKRWEYIYFGDTEDFTLEQDNEFFTFNIEGEDLYVYAYYTGPTDYADVQLDVDVTVVSGPNRNNLSIFCRYSDLGWYEFNILSGGLWTIFKYDETNGYLELASGGSTAIRMGQNENHLTATCVGDTLTFYINDVKVGSARDGAFIEGSYGMSASTFDIGKLMVRFRDFTVRLANPEGELGQAVAPTVPPGFGDQGDANNPWEAFFSSLPLPGESLANEPLQFQALVQVGVLAEAGIPASCQDIRITNTAVQQIVQPFVINEQDLLVQGEWVEVWTLSACGAASNYLVRFTADGPGNIRSSVQRAS